eukprot:5152306-Alexandrium_andersonii.AAC.1
MGAPRARVCAGVPGRRQARAVRDRALSASVHAGAHWRVLSSVGLRPAQRAPGCAWLCGHRQVHGCSPWRVRALRGAP